MQRFAHFIGRYVDLESIRTVIDVGGNDGELLQEFAGRRLVAVDPNASGEGITLIREPIEKADLAQFRGEPKIIISSHTIEHIEKPDAFFEKVAGALFHGEYLALQFPSLERLIFDARIDHIHHQHIHYYSERSISALLAKHGLEIVSTRFDHGHYGSLMVLARRGRGLIAGREMRAGHIRWAHDSYVAGLYPVSWRLQAYPHIAFGAALMLPVLAYHLQPLERVDYIADNDPSKDGLRYINFNTPIRCSYDLEDRDVVITGVATKAAARALTAQAFEKGARNVIVPVPAL